MRRVSGGSSSSKVLVGLSLDEVAEWVPGLQRAEPPLTLVVGKLENIKPETTCRFFDVLFDSQRLLKESTLLSSKPFLPLHVSQIGASLIDFPRE